MHHQFWITKKTFERKLGSKEDGSIISSDADLDTKLSVFKSISQSCRDLSKAIVQYQEHLCTLSKEECKFGTFLKEFGIRSKTTGRSISNCGKVIKCSGEQRMSVSIPLLRLFHEIETFQTQAVNDSLSTVNTLERVRTEYRAAIAWMKSASVELDPDSGKGLGKFRIAQSHLRKSKRVFDNISLDAIQKIDLLVAARCNLYSQTLVLYMSELLQFSKKTSSAFQIVLNECSLNPRYDFCLLKDLSHNEYKTTQSTGGADDKELNSFAEDYIDEENSIEKNNSTLSERPWDELNDELIKLDDTLEHYQTESITLHSGRGYDPGDTSNLLTGNRALLEANNTAILSDTGKELKKLAHMNPKKVYAFMDFFAELDPLSVSKEFQS